MRPLAAVIGIILLLTGVVWALQGAYVLPATFMRGPSWIGSGAALAAVGIAVAFIGLRGVRSSGHEQHN